MTLPVQSGNQPPESAGASLVVVYRTLALTEPLRKVVIYDGFYPQLGLTTPMQQSIQGFYKRSANPSAKLTHIIASGQPNNNDRIRFNGQTLATGAIPAGSSSQRAWANPTFNLSNTLWNQGTTTSTVFGETATTTVDHQPANGSDDCLTWGAVIFSTAVKDDDDDGLPDELEDNPAGLTDPDGRPLPNLNAMGASSSHKDLFIEVNAMWAGAPTPYSLHHHMPTPADLKMVGDPFMARGITPHFDVGDIDTYHALGVVQHSDWIDDYISKGARWTGTPIPGQASVSADDGYLVPSSLARGGELIKEEACDPTVLPSCQFPAYPGTVRWKFGLQAYRDAPVGDNGEQLLTAEEIEDWFDRDPLILPMMRACASIRRVVDCSTTC